MPNPHSVRPVLANHRCFTATVPAVLPGEIWKRFSYLPVDLHCRIEPDAMPSKRDSVIEVDVLVHQQSLVPTVDRLRHRCSIDAERSMVRVLRLIGIVVDRVANTERAGQGRSDGRPCRCLCDRDPDTSDRCNLDVFQLSDTCRQVAGVDAGVSIDSRNELAARSRETDVQCGWDRARRILQNPHSRIRDGPDQFDGPIGGHSVDDEKLERNLLLEYGIDRRDHVAFFVPNRHDHSDQIADTLAPAGRHHAGR